MNTVCASYMNTVCVIWRRRPDLCVLYGNGSREDHSVVVGIFLGTLEAAQRLADQMNQEDGPAKRNGEDASGYWVESYCVVDWENRWRFIRG